MIVDVVMETATDFAVANFREVAVIAYEENTKKFSVRYKAYKSSIDIYKAYKSPIELK